LTKEPTREPTREPSGSSATRSARWAPLVSIVTDRHLTNGQEGLPGRLARALEAVAARGQGGDREPRDVLIHLREKDLGGRELLALARAVGAVTRAAGVRLFVNDRVDVALAAGADGVHLGGGGLSPTEARSIAPGLEVSVATHSVAEIERAAADPAVTFAVLGPIFDTPAKRRFGLPPLGLETLAAATARAAELPGELTGRLPGALPGALPIVAIGGIDAERARLCFAAGASGIACIRGILTAPDPAEALLRLWPSGNRNR
jgi:thiamine-phosphate pyrophosphorylase